MYGVIGNPISHSLSSQIHQNFAKQSGIPLTYQRFLAPSTSELKNSLKFTCNTLFGSGVKGVNVTVPFKELAFQLADTLDEYAKLAKAVNTLKKIPNSNGDGNYTLAGFNTDGIGLLNDLKQKNVWLRESKSNNFEFNILLLGVGGACRGAVAAMILDYLQSNEFSAITLNISLWNRTSERVTYVIDDFKQFLNEQQKSNAHAHNIKLHHLENLENLERGKIPSQAKTQVQDLIINTTSIALTTSADLNKLDETLGLFKKISSHEDSFWYDMSYVKNKTELTPFLTIPFEKRQKYSDGSGMLIKQAAQSFNIWHGFHHCLHTDFQLKL